MTICYNQVTIKKEGDKMQWIIPGTVLTGEQGAPVRPQFEAMFLPGNMLLGQVCGVSGLEPYTVQNWIKRGFLPAPRNKRYTMEQLCRILTIRMLKSALPMERICGLLSYVNGRLDDESDDTVDDAALYFMFLRLAAEAKADMTPEEREKLLLSVTADYAEPVEGAAGRVRQVLSVMLEAWMASRHQEQAEAMLAELQIL